MRCDPASCTNILLMHPVASLQPGSRLYILVWRRPLIHLTVLELCFGCASLAMSSL